MAQAIKNLNSVQKKVIDNQTATVKYNQVNSIKFERENIKLSLRNCSDESILVTGDISIKADNNTDVAFTNCPPFSTWKTETNDVFIDEGSHIYIAIPMYNLIEYNDNYWDSSGSLWHFKRDEVPPDNAELNISQSFKYKAALVGKTTNAAGGNSFVKNSKVFVPLKYLSNFWTSLEMPLINCKIHPELNRIEDCILLSAENTEKF